MNLTQKSASFWNINIPFVDNISLKNSESRFTKKEENSTYEVLENLKFIEELLKETDENNKDLSSWQTFWENKTNKTGSNIVSPNLSAQFGLISGIKVKFILFHYFIILCLF